jgi:hypothetical protein
MRRLGALLVMVLAACSDEQVSTGSDVPPRDDQRYEADLTVLESPDHGPQLCSAVAESYPPQCGGPDIVGWDWEEVDDAESANGTTWGSYHVVGTWDDGTFTLTEPATEPLQARDDPGRDFSPACDEPSVVDPSHGTDEWAADPGFSDPASYVAAWVSDPAGEWDGPFTASVIVRPGRGAEAEERIREHYLGPLCVVERDAPTESELRAVQEEVSHEMDRLGMVSSASDGIEGVVLVDVWVADEATVEYARDRWGDLVRLEGILRPLS